jgi:hypothetical protein
MRRLTVIGITTCLFTLAISYLFLTGRLALIRRTSDWKVAVNGVTVDGDVLAGRNFAIVTRRDKGNAHSYLLFYEGDVDQTGDMGRVVDCQRWIAPRLPILIETGTYPNCKVRHHNSADTPRIALIAKDGVPQFFTTDGNVVSLRSK